MPSTARRHLLRIGALAWKEVLHIHRDIRTLYMALGLPVVMLILFGYGVSFDIRRIPLVVVDQDDSVASRELASHFSASGEFVRVSDVLSVPEAEALFRSGRATAALVIPRGFGRHLGRDEESRVQFLIDGSDGSSATQALGKADAIARAENLRILSQKGFDAIPPLAADVWTRFNPQARSALYLVPGLTAYILAMVSVLLTALTVSREWEKGSMEQLFATPVGRFEIVIGKLLPYLGIGVIQVLLVLAVGSTVFDVPLRGSLWLLGLMAVFFLLGMLGQGLLVSVVARNQMLATQMGMLTSMLPSMLLSGFIIPISNMPWPLQILSHIIPARYFISGLRGILLKGNGLAELWPDLVAQILFAGLMLAVSTARFQRRIA